jgi:ABC-type transport system involved in multi-copper enzyme maturation permease subunit
MQRILAIATLTWKAAFRFRLFWVLTGLLIGSVAVLPLILKDDGTARGFIQIMLTYTLSIITALLGFSTLWLSCGILARDIEECHIQMVAVKPIARWQIWVGKWLGILMLNAALLGVSGGTVYALLQYRAQHLPATEQQVLRNEIFVARGSLKEKLPDLEAIVEKEFKARVKDNAVPPNEYDLLRNQLREMLKAGVQIVPPGYDRFWKLDLGVRKNFLRDQPLYLRIKFHAARTNAGGLYLGHWRVMREQTPIWQATKSMSSDSFHEFQISPNAFEADGKLTVAFRNLNDTALLFPIEDGFEVLYREGGFGLNFIRGLLIIFFWLALLASLGLAASSLMSFPVAAFFSASLLVLALSTGTLSAVVAEGSVLGVNHETGARTMQWLDMVLLPFFHGMLNLINLVESFSPIDALSTGRSISWEELGRAFAQIVLTLGGLIGLVGVFIFTRRELATAQTSQ